MYYLTVFYQLYKAAYNCVWKYLVTFRDLRYVLYQTNQGIITIYICSLDFYEAPENGEWKKIWLLFRYFRYVPKYSINYINLYEVGCNGVYVRTYLATSEYPCFVLFNTPWAQNLRQGIVMKTSLGTRVSPCSLLFLNLLKENLHKC